MARKKKFELNDNNLAIAYYRFSSHSQNEASIDQQRELAHAWADAHGFKIVKEYDRKKQYRSGPADAGIRCGILFRYYASVNNQGIK